MFKRNFILLLLTMTVVIVFINSTNNDELEIVSVSNINDGSVLEDLKQIIMSIYSSVISIMPCQMLSGVINKCLTM